MQLNFDKNFIPMAQVLNNFKLAVEREENKTLKICIERNNGYNHHYFIKIFASESAEKREENYEIVERVVKTLLWIVGGYKIYICGDEYLYERLKQDYSPVGKRAFDVEFMSGVYEREFEVVYCFEDAFPVLKDCNIVIDGNLNGKRIGIDVGGSDIKISAVENGNVVFSKEIVWHPKMQKDCKYHYKIILDAINEGKSRLGYIDGIGVSTAGVCINNKLMVSALFIKVSKEDFNKKGKNIYLNIAKKLGVPVCVANDGDIAALAGAQENQNCVLGIAMGTSEAGGYINEKSGLNGWLSELAFVPIDFNKNSCADEWSGDVGCGVKYLSQDGVIKLAESAGIAFSPKLSPAEKLKEVQSLVEKGNETARLIFEDVGSYFAHAVEYYANFYPIKKVLLLGRVTSGKGGEIILNQAKKVAMERGICTYVEFEMPSENVRRLGQSAVAATLVKI